MVNPALLLVLAVAAIDSWPWGKLGMADPYHLARSGSHAPAGRCTDWKPTGTEYNKLTQCAVLAGDCPHWPQQVCMYNGGSWCECL